MNKKDGSEIVITGTAVLSPVGLNVEQTCASIRSAISRFSDHAYYTCLTEDPEWDEEEPLIASAVPVIDPFLEGPERLYELTISVLRDLIGIAGIKRKELASGGFFMALPQLDPVVKEWELQEQFLPNLFCRTGLGGFKVTRINQSAHAGGYVLMSEAISMLSSGQISFCILGGVDSYLMEDRLGLLDRSRRLKSTRNVDGFVPGEGASMVLLETAAQAKRRGATIQATLLSVSQGGEPQTIESDKSSSGTGLTAALRGVQGFQPNPEIRWVVCDLNGESYRSGEWGIVLCRLAEPFNQLKALWHPANCVGDVGAASAGLFIAIACRAFERRYAPASEALLWSSSDSGQRAACRIGKPN